MGARLLSRTWTTSTTPESLLHLAQLTPCCEQLFCVQCSLDVACSLFEPDCRLFAEARSTEHQRLSPAPPPPTLPPLCICFPPPLQLSYGPRAARLRPRCSSVADGPCRRCVLGTCWRTTVSPHLGRLPLLPTDERRGKERRKRARKVLMSTGVESPMRTVM